MRIFLHLYLWGSYWCIFVVTNLIDSCSLDWNTCLFVYCSPGIESYKNSSPVIVNTAMCLAIVDHHRLRYCNQTLLKFRTFRGTVASGVLSKLYQLHIYKRHGTRSYKRAGRRSQKVASSDHSFQFNPIDLKDQSLWKIEPSRGDGHCLIYSICSAWNHQLPHLQQSIQMS